MQTALISAKARIAEGISTRRRSNRPWDKGSLPMPLLLRCYVVHLDSTAYSGGSEPGDPRQNAENPCLNLLLTVWSLIRFCKWPETPFSGRTRQLTCGSTQSLTGGAVTRTSDGVTNSIRALSTGLVNAAVTIVSCSGGNGIDHKMLPGE